MAFLKQSTSRVRMFNLGGTGLTAAVTISKNGAAFGNPSAGATNATEVSSGWYKVTLSTTDTATLGDLAIHFGAGTVTDFVDEVVVELPGKLAGDQAIGALTVSGGIAVTQSVSNTAGMTITGNGTGHGVAIISGSGATGNGLDILAASTNGVGFNSAGVGTGGGMVLTGGLTGNGLKVVGGGTSGDAILTSATSGHGATFAGTGTTKHGINATGGSTTSHGINAVGGGVGHGILATSGGGATGDGIKAIAVSTNGNGLNNVAVGTGSGILSTGGATGHGVKFMGGATSGDGMYVAGATLGHGINPIGAGTAKTGIGGTLETGYTHSNGLQIILSAVAGKTSISSGTVTIRDVADAADRIVAVTDGNGQRSSVTLTV